MTTERATANRLANSETPTQRTAQDWCDIGNRKLLGLEPTVKHHLSGPRHDVHWVVRNGRPTIEWK